MPWTTPGTATAGEVLTASFWNTNVRDNSNSVGHILVATASFTGSSAVNVNNCFTSAYVNYYVTFNFSAFSGNPDLYLRLRASGSDAATGYQYALEGVRTNGTGSNVLASNSATYIEAIRCRQGAAAPTRHTIQMTFIDPQIAGETKVAINNQCDDGASIAAYSGAGFLLNSTQYDGFTLYPSTGTFAGTYRVYGLRPSF
jgi:hypothetical protein